MSISSYALAIILGGCIVTIIPRVLPIVLFSRIKVPEGISKWLAHVPIAIMSALLVNELLISDNQINISANLLELIAAFPTFLVAVKTKSPIITVAVGVITLMLLRMFF